MKCVGAGVYQKWQIKVQGVKVPSLDTYTLHTHKSTQENCHFDDGEWWMLMALTMVNLITIYDPSDT